VRARVGRPRDQRTAGGGVLLPQGLIHRIATQHTERDPAVRRVFL